jgi:hypothetical protein
MRTAGFLQLLDRPHGLLLDGPSFREHHNQTVRIKGCSAGNQRDAHMRRVRCRPDWTDGEDGSGTPFEIAGQAARSALLPDAGPERYGCNRMRPDVSPARPMIGAREFASGAVSVF